MTGAKMSEHEEVLSVVQGGQELIDTRKEYLARYLVGDPSRTNLHMVDVSDCI